MNFKIAVVGLGQGGAVAAYKLALDGNDVTVYEAQQRGEVSYDWHDDIRFDIFENTDVPAPTREAYRAKSKWLFVSPNWLSALPMPPAPEMEEVSIDRRALSEHFAKLLEEAGCKLRFGVMVTGLALENGSVKGVRTADGEERYDLVIDASGMDSPLRAQLPQKWCVQGEVNKEGVLYGYRAFFKAPDGAKPLEEGINSSLVLKHMGGKGISWCNLTEDGKTDVLIGRIGALSDEEIEAAICDMRSHFDILSEDILSERRVKICLRSGIAVGVADGYVAIGDSAFMTMPLMGSGIESSMKAGKLFADMVANGDVTDFGAAQLWKFWRQYMRVYGGDFALIDVVKSWALAQKPEMIDWVFSSGLIERSDLALVSTDSNATKQGIPAKSIFKKIGILLKKPSFVGSALRAVVRALMAKRCATHAPKKYDERRIRRWAARYDKRIGKYN